MTIWNFCVCETIVPLVSVIFIERGRAALFLKIRKKKKRGSRETVYIRFQTPSPLLSICVIDQKLMYEYISTRPLRRYSSPVPVYTS